MQQRDTTYDRAVREAARALDQGEEANWILARLTYEHTLRAGEKETATGKVAMPKWCTDVREASGRRFSTTTGFRYSSIWATHGLRAGADAGNGAEPSPPAKTLPSFQEAYEAVEGTPDRQRMMDYEGARLLLQGTTAQKVEQAAALLNDPDVRAASTLPGSKLRHAVAEATLAAVRLDQGRREHIISTTPSLAALDKEQAHLALIRLLDGFSTDIEALAPRLGRDRPGGLDAFLRDAWVRLEANLARIRQYVDTGSATQAVDDFLRGVLGSGNPGS